MVFKHNRKYLNDFANKLSYYMEYYYELNKEYPTWTPKKDNLEFKTAHSWFAC